MVPGAAHFRRTSFAITFQFLEIKLSVRRTPNITKFIANLQQLHHYNGLTACYGLTTTPEHDQHSHFKEQT